MFTVDMFGKPGLDGIKACAVLAVVCLQFAVPMIAFMGDPPARFGFQMYSGLGHVNVRAVDGRGEEINIDLSTEVAGLVRPDLDWLGVLPERVCMAAPSAVTVTVEQSGRQRSVKCS